MPRPAATAPRQTPTARHQHLADDNTIAVVTATTSGAADTSDGEDERVTLPHRAGRHPASFARTIPLDADDGQDAFTYATRQIRDIDSETRDRAPPR